MCRVHGGEKAQADRRRHSLETLARLRGIGFLSALSLSDLEAVVSHGSELHLPAECMVDEQTSPGSSLYLLLSGRVRFWVDDVDMRDITLGYAWAPDFFGELCFLSPGRRSTNVTTCTEVDLIQFESKDIQELTVLCPDLIRVLTSEVVARCRGNVETLQNTVFRTAKERVMNTLLAVAQDTRSTELNVHPRRVATDSDMSVVQGYTHEDLASMAFTTRETVTRTLAELESEGVIESRSTGWLRIRPAMIRARLESAAAAPGKPSRAPATIRRAVS